MRILISATLVLFLAMGWAPPEARAANPLPMPAHGVIGVEGPQLTPQFWLARLAHPDQVIMDRQAIAAYDARVTRLDPEVYDLQDLPAKLDGTTLKSWIEHRSHMPAHALYDVHGQAVPESRLDGFARDLALDRIPAKVSVRYGLVVHRAALRTFPTMLRVFSEPGETDIDRFQETALVPGTPVAVLHESLDGRWYFVEAPRYRAWVEKKYVAIGAAREVFAYADKAPYRVVTGASVRTVFTPERPAVSQLQLDMGARVPFDPDWPADRPVNGQGPSGAWVIELPMRNADGSLGFAHALLQRNADTRAGYLPLTRADIVRQAFKFLGERYGWGDAYDGRDCSGFVSDVYRSMGILMPRNTSAQSVSPAADRTSFDASTPHAERLRAVQSLEVGDLVYIPGHVMMVVGRLYGQPYVIHDVLGATFFGPGGKLEHVKLNEVSVTPLLPMQFNRRQSFVDRMTAIVRIRPRGD